MASSAATRAEAIFLSDEAFSKSSWGTIFLATRRSARFASRSFSQRSALDSSSSALERSMLALRCSIMASRS